MTLRVLGWVLLAQALGGVTPALTKLALQGLEPWTLVRVRQVLGTGFLVAMTAAGFYAPARAGSLRKMIARFERRDWVLLLLLSWAGFALPQILGAQGLDLSTATNGALLSPLEPIGILIGGAFFLREPLTRARVVAVVLGVAGATLIVAQGAGASAAGSLRGDALMAAGHLAWAIYTLAAKPLVGRNDPLRIAILASALSPLPLIPLAIAEPLDPSRAVPAIGWIVLLAFLATSMASWVWNRALQAVSAGTMAAFIFVQPIVGLLLGTIALGEPIGWQALGGASLIVAGVVIAALRGEGDSA